MTHEEFKKMVEETIFLDPDVERIAKAFVILFEDEQVTED